MTSVSDPTPAGGDVGGRRDRSESSGLSIRWWPLVAGVVMALAASLVFSTAWTGVWGSHPIGWLTLVASILAGGGLVAFAVRVAPRDRSRLRRWSARAGLVVCSLLVVGTIFYTAPLPADQVALDAVRDGGGVSVDDSATRVRLDPDRPKGTGLAFYPGARVDPRAYANVLRPVAEAGYPVVIFKQPFNLAILDGDAASGVIGASDDDVGRWVVGGHSLGGAMAARYAESERDELEGLLLYAAYPVNDMSDRTGLSVLSVSGTNDGLADIADIDASMAELPPTAEFVRIEGAIHSYFGDYGEQRGDGTPTLSRQAAQDQIATATIDHLDSVERGTAAAD